MILRLYSENIKCLKAVDIYPNETDYLKLIVGKNAAGKSATLNSILWLLGGARGIPEEVVREGQNKAEIILETKIFTARRVWKNREESKLEVIIHDKDYMGMTPVAFLKKIAGDLSFDPLDFVRMDKAQQIEQLKKIFGLDFSELDQEIKSNYDHRTEANKEVGRLKAELGSLVDIQDPGEIEPIGELQAKRDKLKTENGEISYAKSEVSRLEERALQLKDELTQVENRIREILPIAKKSPHDLTEIEQKIENISELTLQKVNWEKRKELEGKLGSAVKTSNDLSSTINDLKDNKVKNLIMANEKLGIEYLNFDEEGIEYKNRSLELASQKEQIDISMQIAMSQKLPFKVILIREGGFLDDKSLKYLKTVAQKNKYFLWIEYPIGFEEESIVKNLSEIGEVFYIEEGSISTKYLPEHRE